jgi:hypothetical protein
MRSRSRESRRRGGADGSVQGDRRAPFYYKTTVKSHLRAIFSKLDVLSRTEAVTAVNRRGLIQL